MVFGKIDENVSFIAHLQPPRDPPLNVTSRWGILSPGTRGTNAIIIVLLPLKKPGLLD